VGGEHPDSGVDPPAQMLPGVRVGHRIDHPLEACPVPPQIGAERVEQPSSRTEDQIDGGPGDTRHPGDLLDADRLGRRLTQLLVDRVEDAPPSLLGPLRAQSLFVLPGDHSPHTSISLDMPSPERQVVHQKTSCPTNQEPTSCTPRAPDLR
jgi:hypothetical protein